MKKTLFAVLIANAALVSAQCTINGPSTVKLGEDVVFSVDKELAQCTDCHQWRIPEGSFSTTGGNSKKNSIKINPSAIGNSSISLSVMTPKGMQDCSKSIEIVDKATSTQQTTSQSGNCTISVKEFQEIKLNDNTVVLYPNVRNQSYVYQWKLGYANGTFLESKDIVPSFQQTPDNNIVSAVLKIELPSCVRTYTKSYDVHFWKYF